jgi:hypothetical protein
MEKVVHYVQMRPHAKFEYFGHGKALVLIFKIWKNLENRKKFKLGLAHLSVPWSGYDWATRSRMPAILPGTPRMPVLTTESAPPPVTSADQCEIALSLRRRQWGSFPHPFTPSH